MFYQFTMHATAVLARCHCVADDYVLGWDALIVWTSVCDCYNIPNKASEHYNKKGKKTVICKPDEILSEQLIVKGLVSLWSSVFISV